MAEMMLITKEGFTECFSLFEKNYGYLIETAEGVISSTESTPKSENLETSNIAISEKLEVIKEHLNNLHDYTGRFVIQKRL